MVTKAKPKADKLKGTATITGNQFVGSVPAEVEVLPTPVEAVPPSTFFNHPFTPVKKKAKTISKSAETGKIVSKKFAADHPDTTFETKAVKHKVRPPKYKTGVRYCFSNADTSFVGCFTAFDPDVVVREDGTTVVEFDERNYIIEVAAAPIVVPELREVKVPKYDPETRYFMTSKGGEDFIGTVLDGVVYRNELIGGVQVENALHEKPSEFKIRPATGPEIRPLKIMVP